MVTQRVPHLRGPDAGAGLDDLRRMTLFTSLQSSIAPDRQRRVNQRLSRAQGCPWRSGTTVR